MTVVVKVEKNGKLLLPASIRRALNIREGDSDLLLKLDAGKKSITLETREQALTRIRKRLARYIPEGTLLFNELIADRRSESRRE